MMRKRLAATAFGIALATTATFAPAGNAIIAYEPECPSYGDCCESSCGDSSMGGSVALGLSALAGIGIAHFLPHLLPVHHGPATGPVWDAHDTK